MAVHSHHCNAMAREIIVSPRGEALWAKVLGEATAFEDNPRSWSVTLVLDPANPETVAFIERLEACFREFHGEKVKVAKNGWPFSEQTSQDESGREVKTGLWEFRFKRKEMTARGNKKDAPIVVDSRKNLWPMDLLIGNGSKIKVAFSPWPWEMNGGKGMSLELEQIQVLELVEYAQNRDPFEEEDGYIAPTTGAQTAFDREEAPAAAQPSFADQLRQRAAEVQASVQVDDEIPF